MTSVFHPEIFLEFILGIIFSATFTWLLYIRRHRKDQSLTPVASLSLPLDELELPPEEGRVNDAKAEYLTTEATDLKPMFTQITNILNRPTVDEEVVELKREIGVCIRCLSDFGESLEDHYETNPHHRHKEDVEEKTADHIHRPSAGSFEIRSGEVLCSVCSKPIHGLKRVGGHQLDIRHSTHGEESYVQ